MIYFKVTKVFKLFEVTYTATLNFNSRRLRHLFLLHIFMSVIFYVGVMITRLSSNDSFISLSIDGTMILFALLSMMKITLIKFGHRKSSFVVFERFQKYFSIRLTLQKHRTENLYKASGLGSNTQSLFIPYRFQDG